MTYSMSHYIFHIHSNLIHFMPSSSLIHRTSSNCMSSFQFPTRTDGLYVLTLIAGSDGTVYCGIDGYSEPQCLP